MRRVLFVESILFLVSKKQKLLIEQHKKTIRICTLLVVVCVLKRIFSYATHTHIELDSERRTHTNTNCKDVIFFIDLDFGFEKIENIQIH